MVNDLAPIVGRFEEIDEGNAVSHTTIFNNGGAEQTKIYTAEDRRDTMAAAQGGQTGLPGWKEMIQGLRL